MELERFRTRVLRAFGEDLHQATPATVREFLDRLQQETSVPRVSELASDNIAADYPADLLSDEPTGDNDVFDDEPRIRVDETARSYEEVMRTFFVRVLEVAPEKAVPLLWTVALDLSYAIIESHDADRIGHLFRDMDEPSLGD